MSILRKALFFLRKSEVSNFTENQVSRFELAFSLIAKFHYLCGLADLHVAIPEPELGAGRMAPKQFRSHPVAIPSPSPIAVQNFPTLDRSVLSFHFASLVCFRGLVGATCAVMSRFKSCIKPDRTSLLCGVFDTASTPIPALPFGTRILKRPRPTRATSRASPRQQIGGIWRHRTTG